MEKSFITSGPDAGLDCFVFHLQISDTLLHCKTKLFLCWEKKILQSFGASYFVIFTV